MTVTMLLRNDVAMLLCDHAYHCMTMCYVLCYELRNDL